MIELVSFNIVIFILLITLYMIRKAKSLESFPNFYLGIILLVLVGGVLDLNNSMNNIKDFLDRREWPVVAGEIVSLQVVGIKTREPAIKYIYKVEDKTYSNTTNLNTPFFGSSKSQQQASQTILSNYAIGDTVIVYFNPQNYSESVLKVTPHFTIFMQYSFGIFLTAILLALIINRLFMAPKEKTN